MSELVKICDYVSGVLSFDKRNVFIGRVNFERSDFSTDLITVDSVSPAVVINSRRSYNGDTEVETFETKYSQLFDIDFYGDNAESNAKSFINFQRSQLAYELRRDLLIDFKHVQTILNLKPQRGDKWRERYKLTVNIAYSSSDSITTLRIDNVENSFLVNK